MNFEMYLANISLNTLLYKRIYILRWMTNPFWEADSPLASQEIIRLLWSPTVDYCVYKNRPLELYPEQDEV
jgi:hypothetical protein